MLRMKKQLFIIIAVAILSVQSARSNEINLDYRSINASIVENIILKDYAQLASLSETFNQNIQQACSFESSGEGKVNSQKIVSLKLQKLFIELRLAWAKVQLISFGPISFLERRERLDYWPDKHRVGERQLRKLLNSEEPIEWNIENFRDKSVAVQGLNAMERILFSKEEYLDNKRCQLAKLVAVNVMNISAEVSSQWSKKPIEFKNDLLNPSPDLTFFANSKEVSSVLLNDMSTQLRFLSDIKIANGLPKKGNKAGNYRQLESWRTGSTFALMKSNILTIENYYKQGFAEQIIKFWPKKHQQIIKLFTDALDIVEFLHSQATVSMNQLLTQQNNLDRLKQLQNILFDIDVIFKKEIVSALNLNIKFNALDGD